MRARRWTWTLGVLATGCAMDLPQQDYIISTRPLALRVEVLDPAADPADAVRNEALPTERIEMIPLIVDEQGPLTDDRIETEIEPVWLACPLQPIEGLFGCLSSRFPLELSEIADCPTVDLAALDPENPQVPDFPVPCRITGGTVARPQMQVPLHPNLLIGGDLEITMIGHVPGSGDTATCAEALLGEASEIPSACLFTTQRASVGPDSAIAQLAASFGFEGLGEFGPVPDEIPDADRHPRIATFSIAIRDGDEVLEAHPVARGDVVTAQLGHEIEIITSASEDDLQTYLIPEDNDAFAERSERFAGKWYRTWGDLLSPVSDDPMSMNTWSLVPGDQDEDELPDGGRATLYYVLRDGRQGVDWFWFSVDVSE